MFCRKRFSKREQLHFQGTNRLAFRRRPVRLEGESGNEDSDKAGDWNLVKRHREELRMENSKQL